jgi:hypothetical protein
MTSASVAPGRPGRSAAEEEAERRDEAALAAVLPLGAEQYLERRAGDDEELVGGRVEGRDLGAVGAPCVRKAFSRPHSKAEGDGDTDDP